MDKKITATLRRNTAGRFGVAFRAPGDGTLRIDSISEEHDMDDERMQLCVGDIVERLNGIVLTKSLREKGLQSLLARAGHSLSVSALRPGVMVSASGLSAERAAARADLEAADGTAGGRPLTQRELKGRNPSLRSIGRSSGSLSSRKHMEEGDVIGAASAAASEAAARARLALDTDGDGKISASELAAGTKRAIFASAKNLASGTSHAVSAAQKQAVQSLDTDGDGKVSAAEMAAGAATAARRAKANLSKSARDLRAALDTDGDGNVSAAELAAGLRRARLAFIKRVVLAMSLATVWVANLVAVCAMGLVAFGAAFVLTPNELWLALISWGVAVVWTTFAIEPLWIVSWVILTATVRWLLSLGFDTDGDGKISLKELRLGTKKAAAQKAERMKAEMDADGDGKLSAGEVAAAIGRSTRNLCSAAGSAAVASTRNLLSAAGANRAGSRGRNLRRHPAAQ